MSVGRAILGTSTLLIGGISLHAIVTGVGLPWAVVVGLLAGYLAVCFAGAMLPRFEMFGDVLSRVPSAANGTFALTFDDGPDPRSAAEVLRLLGKYRFRATFFVIGDKVRDYPELASAIAREGHELAVHSMSHPRSYPFWNPRRIQADLASVQRLLKLHAGVEARFFRPPGLVVSPRTISGAARAGLAIAGTSVRAFDGTQRARALDVRNRLKRAKSGDIVLMHDASERDGGPLPIGLTFL
jgi:peptidoglycan-N-acetylglucosamine deacetylase